MVMVRQQAESLGYYMTGFIKQQELNFVNGLSQVCRICL